ncbi:hypothetical protein HPB50_008684 [Hyalomma asiaticum]|uniref:Uncharacterized protein n=1 Tax=Hyalomma asiaticum TaxID=266040 RepID=A0ACB7TF70_HYAAI|nr:hypothetical protein HPB50_008684 [Hyalomma asiaticum]
MPRRLTLEERYEIVSLGKPLSQREISRKLNRPLKTVNRILRAFSQEDRLEDAPHQRRPRRTTEEEDALIIAAAVNDPFTTAKKIKEELGLHLSLSAIRRRLNAAGLRSHDSWRTQLQYKAKYQRRKLKVQDEADHHLPRKRAKKAEESTQKSLPAISVPSAEAHRAMSSLIVGDATVNIVSYALTAGS